MDKPPSFVGSRHFHHHVHGLPQRGVAQLLLFVGEIGVFPTSPTRCRTNHVRKIPIEAGETVRFAPRARLLMEFRSPFTDRLVIRCRILKIFQHGSFHIFRGDHRPADTVQIGDFRYERATDGGNRIDQADTFDIMQRIQPADFRRHRLGTSHIARLRDTYHALGLAVQQQQERRVLGYGDEVELRPLVVDAPSRANALEKPEWCGASFGEPTESV